MSEDIILKRRNKMIYPDNEDLLVDPWESPKWMQIQMHIRVRCLALTEDYGLLLWSEHGRKGEPRTLPQEGWLLVEDKRIIGATSFAQIQYISPTFGRAKPWIWVFAFIDPEHRRKGYVSKRIPKWLQRYGKFLLDTPNKAAEAMLLKAGYGYILDGMMSSMQRGISLTKGPDIQRIDKYLFGQS